MSIENLKNKLPDFAKDIRLNLSTLFTQRDQSGLTPEQFYGVALSVAYVLKNKDIIKPIEQEAGEYLTSDLVNAAKTAAVLMSMNNIYYRFIHLAKDKEFTAMPAQLRMNSMRNSGVSQLNFELFSLVVSAINGCGLCIDSHVKQLIEHGMEKGAIQRAIKMAAILHAVDTACALSSNMD